MAAVATASRPSLCDPFSAHHGHFSPSDTCAVLELLATDRLVDSHAPPSAETNLLNDLLAVDAEFAAANARDHESVATAPALRGEKDLLLDLLRTDQQVDGAKEGRRRAASGTLHDPYVKEVYTAVEQSGGWSPGDDPVMMQLLAVDESVGDGRRRRQLVQSEASAIIGDLHEVDREVGAARRRALLVEDLQALLDVDHLVGGVTKAKAERGGKRSIFSVKEKYTAKVSSKYAK